MPQPPAVGEHVQVEATQATIIIGESKFAVSGTPDTPFIGQLQSDDGDEIVLSPCPQSNPTVTISVQHDDISGVYEEL